MATVQVLGEVGLIERLRRRVESTARSRHDVVVGIGDDAAVLRPPIGRWRWLLASDLLVEGVHFRLPAPARAQRAGEPRSKGSRTRQAGRRDAPARHVGWKALACNVSDIAAMGGLPRWAVVSLGLPPETPVSFVDGLYHGLTRCARRYGVAIVGGDTVRAPQLVVDVAIMGVARPSHLVLRSGARVGDLLYVTGRLGGSYRSGRHARCVPRVKEAQVLVRRLRVHAMIDLSDGLASDLWQISRASGVALRVEASKIPVSRAGRTCLRRACPCHRWRGRQAVFHALMDGEDFELLFAVAPREAPRVPARIGSCPVTCIGRAVHRGIGVELQGLTGRVRPIVPQGFVHF